ncbi:GAP family protein [Methanobacterium oryzae]|uniref:GAP family protein n=1 Tax=Methanobacterium oryzae TaxID=69540 RepID=UPI003D19605F
MSELSSIIVSILPYAIGALFSPFILANLLEANSPGNYHRLSSFAYLLGSIIIFLILVFFGLYIGTGLSTTILGPIKVGSIIEVVLGGILIIIGVKSLFVREYAREGGILGFTFSLREDNDLSVFVKFFYLGFITILASFTAAILIAVAGIIIGLSTPTFTNSAITVIILGIISLFMVIIAFILYLLSSDYAEDLLDPFRGWTVEYGDYLAAIVYFLLGLFFIIRGFIFFRLI